MRLMKMLNTNELEEKIRFGISKVKDIEDISDLKFQKNIENGEDAIYIFSDLQGYHYVLMEKMCIRDRRYKER